MPTHFFMELLPCLRRGRASRAGWRRRSEIAGPFKTAAQRQVEIDPGVQSLPPNGQVLPFGIEGAPLGVQHGDHVAESAVVPRLRELPGGRGLRGGFQQRGLPPSEQPIGRQG